MKIPVSFYSTHDECVLVDLSSAIAIYSKYSENRKSYLLEIYFANKNSDYYFFNSESERDAVRDKIFEILNPHVITYDKKIFKTNIKKYNDKSQ